MNKLLSLPPNLVDYFHEIEKVAPEEYFCTSDPRGKRLGSGGGTTWLLDACRGKENFSGSLSDWLPRAKRILIHAGGLGRRLPAYAPSGKVLTPVPVFRWARGQRLSQNLLSLQLPLYEQIMDMAPESFHTLVVSGDVYIRTTEPLQNAPIPEADVVCYGLWVDPSLASHHGVFLSRRESPETLDYMLQKPSKEILSSLAASHFFLMDIGVWLLSDRAVRLLADRSRGENGELHAYDLYGEFGLALGANPQIRDEELNSLSVAILPLPGGEFYHFGTSHELISSTLAIQNLIRDQRAIMQLKVKPHPAMFVQNAIVRIDLTPENSGLWIENSCIGPRWSLTQNHLITGVPENDWNLTLAPSNCVDIVPWGNNAYVARPYDIDDSFRGDIHDPATTFLGISLLDWFVLHGLDYPVEATDIFDYPLFPVAEDIADLGEMLRWMLDASASVSGRDLYLQAEKLSAAQMLDGANLRRLAAQRESFRLHDWPELAKNHTRSVFYQLDLADAARDFARYHLPLPDTLSADVPLMKRIHNHAFRARVLSLIGEGGKQEQEEAFAVLRSGLVDSVRADKQAPRLSVYPDQIVWGRSPVRIDLAGGWTDTPPYCMYAGGNVVNVAIDLNGQPPLQVYIKPCDEPRITLRSIDLGAVEVISTFEELHNYNKVGSPFSIPKAALSLAGFDPRFAVQPYDSLESALRAFGGGLEISLLAAVPAGSGLGTSSILAATVLGALSDFCGLGWDKNAIGYRTLILEQLLTTGGGWQDQFGGILHGLKLLQTSDGFNQSPLVRWLPDSLFTNEAYRPCHLLYYTGITRTAKGILAEIVQGMFLNSGPHLAILDEMKAHALNLFEAIQREDFETFGKLVGKSWRLNQALDSGTNPPSVQQIIEQVHDYCLGYKLPGAGGGGFLYMVAKDPEAAQRIRALLREHPVNNKARFVELSLSHVGLQVTRS